MKGERHRLSPLSLKFHYNNAFRSALCEAVDRDEMSNLYREPSIDASYQVLVHLAKRFQRRFLQLGQSETSIACGCHVS
jgi:hypothetical protein